MQFFWIPLFKKFLFVFFFWENQFFIFGGYNKEDEDSMEFLQNPVFSDSGVLFSAELHGEKPSARYGHTISAISDETLLLFGGIDENSPNNDCL